MSTEVAFNSVSAEGMPGCIWRAQDKNGRFCYIVGTLYPIPANVTQLKTIQTLFERANSWLFDISRHVVYLEDHHLRNTNFSHLISAFQQALEQKFSKEELYDLYSKIYPPFMNLLDEVYKEEAPATKARFLAPQKAEESEEVFSSLFVLVLAAQYIYLKKCEIPVDHSLTQSIEMRHYENNLDLETIWQLGMDHPSSWDRTMLQLLTAPMYFAEPNEISKRLSKLEQPDFFAQFQSEIHALVQAWMQGDVDYLQTHVMPERDYQRVGVATEKVLSFLAQSKRALKCVSLSIDLLLTDQGILNRLKEEGVSVEQIKDADHIEADYHRALPLEGK